MILYERSYFLLCPLIMKADSPGGIKMSDEVKADEKGSTMAGEQIKKEDMVGFLSSSGRVSEELASSLYDQGLNSWKGLTEGTEASFKNFKGVGPAKAKILVELGIQKRSEMEVSVPGLKEVLESIPRMNQKIISALLESGYDSVESFKDIAEKDLQAVKGVGPKMAAAILEAVKHHVETYGEAKEAGPHVEEATAEIVSEEEAAPADERSLIQRIIDAIGGFFGGKKKEEGEQAEEVPGEQETIEAQPEEKEEEPAKEEAPKEEEPAPEEVSEEVPVEEEPAEEAPKEKEEEASEKPPEPEKEEAEEAEEAPETVVQEETPAKPGFFERIKQMFMGGSKKEEDQEKPEAEEPAKDEAPKEEKEEAVSEPTAEETPEPEEESTPPKEPKVKALPPADSEKIENFEDIPGVSKKTAEILKKAGYLSVEELREAVPEDLEMIEGIGPKTAEKICKALKDH